MEYSLGDFQSIKKSDFDYTIPPEARELITMLANLVGSPNYSKSPYFIKTDKRKRNNKPADTNENWEILRNFKTTELEKKTGVEKDMVEIRSLLNKLTKDNYTSIKQQIIQKLNGFGSTEDFSQVITFLFSIASTNKFYSVLYASLYKDLLKTYPQIRSEFDNTLQGYLSLFSNIQSCNPKENYNLFCDINKENDRRRAISAFIVNLLLKEEVDIKTVNLLIMKLQKMLIDNSSDTMKTEEITENLFVIISIGLDVIAMSDEWGNIYDYIQSNSQNKLFSNKIRFRFMDLLDITDKSQ